MLRIIVISPKFFKSLVPSSVCMCVYVCVCVCVCVYVCLSLCSVFAEETTSLIMGSFLQLSLLIAPGLPNILTKEHLGLSP